jgi:hypothetical protein
MLGFGELRKWLIYAVFGVAMWFIYQGTFNFFASLGIKAGESIAIGLVMILGLLTVFKFKGIGF